MRRFRQIRSVVALAALAVSAPVLAQEAPKPEANAPANRGETNLDLDALLSRDRDGSSGSSSSSERKYRDFDDVTRGAHRYDGLFTLHLKDDHLYAEIKPHQFDQPMLAPITIARGIAQAGIPLDPFDEMVLVFHKAGDRVQLIRRNIHYKAPANTPIEKAVKQNYTDSILMALPIISVNRSGGNSTLIDLSDIFMSDFAQLGLGFFDKSRSNWSKVKAFNNNIELELEATFGGGRYGNGDDDGVVDSRGVTVVVHYSLMKLPEAGYRPRMADDRVGHFLSASKDFGQVESPTAFVRMVNRWRLEKADSRAKLSAPKKQIVFYVEDTVPFEYRSFVEEGIREWNKAFEKIGFRDAIAVRWQQPGEEFDPEDADHCTFRWITTNRTYAMSCLRANPITGELIDGDVIFDASWIRAWKDQYALLTGIPEPKGAGDLPAEFEPVAIGEVISPILADKMRFGQPGAQQFARLNGQSPLALVPAEATPLETHLAQRLRQSQVATCQFSGGMQTEMSLALLAFADEKKEEAEAKLPEDLIGQAIKEVTMHEVGHSLGLRHNFKASTMLSVDQLNDTSITRAKGNTASVMDYTPINLAPKGQKQGDYFTTTIGPYDYWAIEYAYKPIDGNEESELRKIAARAPEDDLIFATDEDMHSNNDPLVNTYDLGSDVCRFARDRMALASSLMKDLDDKTVKDGESWARNRQAFSVVLRQYGDASHLLSSYIAGQEVHRDHKGDKDARDPIVPIPGAKQREALDALVSGIFSDRAFQFSPETLRRLGLEKWSHWGSSRGGSIDFPVLERVLSIQRIALSHSFNPDVLARLENQELQVDPASKPLKMSELFSALTDGIWKELTAPPADADKPALEISTIRRNLQREHLRHLSGLVLASTSRGYADQFVYVDFGNTSVPADARALARLHLKTIRDRVSSALDRPGVSIDDTTRAHLEETRDRISKVLDASLQAGSF